MAAKNIVFALIFLGIIAFAALGFRSGGVATLGAGGAGGGYGTDGGGESGGWGGWRGGDDDDDD